MKKGFLALIFILAGLLLVNMPPGNDQSVDQDYQIEMSFDQTAVAITSPATIETTALFMPWDGGLVLQTHQSSWSATLLNDYNQIALRNARNGLLYSQGQSNATLSKTKAKDYFLPANLNMPESMEGFDVGKVNASWRFQTT